MLDTSIEKRNVASSQTKSDAWLEKLHSIKLDIDPSLIDMDDERTNISCQSKKFWQFLAPLPASLLASLPAHLTLFLKDEMCGPKYS